MGHSVAIIAETNSMYFLRGFHKSGTSLIGQIPYFICIFLEISQRGFIIIIISSSSSSFSINIVVVANIIIIIIIIIIINP